MSARIGGVEVDSEIWLAPLAGITTVTFRAHHRRLGAGLVHTEMISAVGMSHKNGRTSAMLSGDDSGPVALQLFAPDADSLMRGAELAVGARVFDALEINMACPMPKVTKRGSGAKLLERPGEAKKMVAGLRRFGYPVWVKLRITDPEKGGLSTVDFCSEMTESGAELLLLHGRTPAQRYEGEADKDAVCRAAAAFPGMVAASGDYYAPPDAIKYLEGGCAAVLAARGSLRDAFIIPRTLRALGREVDDRFAEPTMRDRIDALIRIGRMGVSSEGERFTLVLAKRMLGGFFRGFSGASAIRQLCAGCGNWEAMEETLSSLPDICEAPGML